VPALPLHIARPASTPAGFKDAKPADLPVILPAKFELVARVMALSHVSGVTGRFPYAN
jgi:hypothetical protein